MIIISQMSHLHADRQIVVELITVWTTAFVTANCIDAATVAARRSVAFILVYALIVIKMLDKAVRASTAIAAHEILKYHGYFVRQVIS